MTERQKKFLLIGLTIGVWAVFYQIITSHLSGEIGGSLLAEILTSPGIFILLPFFNLISVGWLVPIVTYIANGLVYALLALLVEKITRK